jgi:branched-chain amino acid transport system permease protein
MPHLLPLPAVDFFIRTLIIVIAVIGLNFITGYCGQLSLGHAAFAAVGAFAGALFFDKGVPYLVSLLLAGIIAGIAGVIFAVPASRFRGLYTAFTTLAAHFIIWFMLVHYFRGEVGIPVGVASVGGIDFDSEFRFYYLVITAVIILTYAAKNIARSKTGRAFVAVRDHDIAADIIGINIFNTKLLAFSIGCFYAGISGFLWVSYLGWASIEQFTLWQAIWYLGIIIVGGAGTIVGSIFGVFFIRGVEEAAHVVAPLLDHLIPYIGGTAIGALPVIIFSIVVILFIIFEPRGLVHRWNILKTSARIFPFNY